MNTDNKTLQEVLDVCRHMAVSHGKFDHLSGSDTRDHRYDLDVLDYHIKASPISGIYVGVWGHNGVYISQGSSSANVLSENWLGVAQKILDYALLERMVIRQNASSS